MSYRHLTRDDRVALAAFLRAKTSLSEISVALGFHPSTIAREITRNSTPAEYSVLAAKRKSGLRRHAANQCHRQVGLDTDLTDTVKSLLELEWSPEQIAGRMKLEVVAGLVPKSFCLTSASSIYTWANPDPDLFKLLPRKHSKYRRKHGITDREKKRLEESGKRCITERPACIDNKARIGDWEGDTIVGQNKRERILTHTERVAGYLLASKTKDGTAASIRLRTEADFRAIPATKKLTRTLDNGTEHAEWELTERHTGMLTYFAHPYHS